LEQRARDQNKEQCIVSTFGGGEFERRAGAGGGRCRRTSRGGAKERTGATENRLRELGKRGEMEAEV
jgi:hypothetical protein